MGGLVLGVDSSTGSVKVEARSLADGSLVASGHAPHPPAAPPCSEQDPRRWWDALVDATAQLGELRSSVVAMSVAAQQHGLVVTDGEGAPLRPAKLWNDTESAACAATMVDALGADAWARACGSVPVAAFTITKLAFLALEEPDLLGHVERLFLPHDWLTFALTGRHVTDRGDASGTGWWDAASGGLVDPSFLDAAMGSVGVSADALGGHPAAWLAARVPEVLGPTASAGRIRAAAALELGLGADVLVGPGTGDNMAAALGLGLEPGDVVVSLGTSGTVYAASEVPTRDPAGEVAGFADAAGGHLPLVCTLNATRVTDTVAGWLGVGLDELAEMALVADPRSPSVPVMLPYLEGERTPNLPDATGSLSGLRTSTSREELALSAHDAVLSGLLAGRGAIERLGVEVDRRLFLVGGGSRSRAFRQRLADLSSREVIVPEEPESVAAGAALQAAAVATSAGSGEAYDAAAQTGGPALLRSLAARWSLGRGSSTRPR